MKKIYWIIGAVILAALIIFFFPKSCGGRGGIGGQATSMDCKCIGISAPSLMNRFVLDASFTSCYGVCLKNTCKTKVVNPQFVGGCAGVQNIYWNECCENWASENNIARPDCVGNWTVENNVCMWNCESEDNFCITDEECYPEGVSPGTDGGLFYRCIGGECVEGSSERGPVD